MKAASLPGMLVRLVVLVVVINTVLVACLVAGLHVVLGPPEDGPYWVMALATAGPGATLLAGLLWSLWHTRTPGQLARLLAVALTALLAAAPAFLLAPGDATPAPISVGDYLQAGIALDGAAGQRVLYVAATASDEVRGVVALDTSGASGMVVTADRASATVAGNLRFQVAGTTVTVQQPTTWLQLTPGAAIEAFLDDVAFLGDRLLAATVPQQPISQQVSDSWPVLIELTALAMIGMALGGVIGLVRWPVLGGALALAAWRGVLAGYPPLTGSVQNRVAQIIRDLSFDALIPAVALAITAGFVLLLGSLRVRNRRDDD